ncbi:T9SS type B sorting domain-containing protein [Flavobacterium sp. LS1R47]|uniref:T9SS type B sorting domain-containing protein n=1 Tax=Flavobacterium frigoritolerans TaxID=2987686 RepID=A0A9X3C6L0_9FLAO|nr:T9SS type B sorting domain-containing protein [Flavobacterium frigoritolerans]MCV9932354.1 T9SS type B sorting domain-containing protein [Flavobacterium frigoritolerans]
MKKPTILKIALFVLIFLQSIISYSQNFKSFDIRYNNNNESLNGDILLIGNNILNRDNGSKERPEVPYIGNLGNDKFNMKYIDIDGDPNTFNSSSAKLTLPGGSCSKIVYAGLYWSAVTRDKSSNPKPIDKVKFKMPGGSYVNIDGTVIYDANNKVVGTSYPYACYANVTEYFTKTPLPTVDGDYTVANVSTAQGSNRPDEDDSGGTGLSAGWSLFIVYENATLPAKAITSFDGFSAIDAKTNLNIKVSGFKAIKVGPVRAKFAFSALEGDLPILGDFLAINGVKSTPPERPSIVERNWEWNPSKWKWEWVYTENYNFFNSSVTSLGTILNNREPNSSNTLGFDAGVFEVNNPITPTDPGGSVIKNGDTEAVISLGSTQDVYFYYFNAFAIEIIAPRIVLLKKVIGTDENGKDYDASNKDIGIDKDLRYEIEFQNKGNDDAVNFTITDILPNNIIFDETKDILFKSPGVTVASYDKATRTIVFNIDPILVKEKGGVSSIKFRVKTIKDCESLTDACSNVIKNTAISKYNGTINKANFGEGSLSSEEGCNVGVPTATNFLIGLDKCKFEQTLFLCGSVKLKAGGGYKTYVWTDQNGVVFGGNNQEVTVTKPGTYTVVTSATPPCLGIQQKFIVKDYNVDINDNPVNSYADNIDPETKLPYICNNDGKPFPKIFLCGKTATKFIDTKITGASSIVWQETKDIPSSTLSDRCPDVEAKNWTEVGVGPTYTANKAGTFRLIVTYNNTCFNIYYFNVTQSVVDPTFIKEDIICDTKGSITITNPKPNDGHGYEYSLDGKEPYQASNVFDDVAAGRYLVHIRTKSVDNKFEKCIYTADVTISKLTFSTKVETTDPYCNGKTGTIKATATGVRGWYQFTVKDAITGALKGDSGQIADPKNFHLFEGIAPGTYNVEITSKDGCKETKEVTINDFLLAATATITKSLTCEEGEITVVATGGKPVAGIPPYYYYYVNGAKIPLTDPVIPIGTAGNYSIVVIDDSGCSVTIPTIIVPDIIRPTATINKKDAKCFGSATGEISITLNPTDSPYTVSYSVNGLAGPFESFNPIKNLAEGDYDVVVRYTYDNVDCFDESKIITIGGAGSALTASAGVAELSGCGLPGNEKQGKVRITNAQGGKPFPAPHLYKYSFDGGNTWQDSNEAYINPSTTPYTFYIKDAADCIFPMEGIILEEKPDDPTIEVSTPTFNCDGSANTTVTVTNTGGANYEYEYYLNDVLNPNTANPNIFLNVPPSAPGSYHVISVRYKLVSVPTYSHLLKEDFGSGPSTTSPGINTTYYCFERQLKGQPATYCKNDYLMNDGDYAVTSALHPDHASWSWVFPKDHTSDGKDTKGRFLVVNIGDKIPVTTILYEKQINDIIPNQPINFEFFAMNLMKYGAGKADPDLRIALIDATGQEISWFATGKIPRTSPDNLWEQYPKTPITLNPGDNKSLRFIIRSNVRNTNGNDVVIDDISVYQLPKSCLSTKDFKVVVDPNKKFTAEVKNVIDTKCKGSKDGSLTIIASNFNTTNGFEYSIDGGNTWINSKLEETIVDGLGEGDLTVQIRYDKNVTGCDFTIGAKITSPSVFEVDATATVAKCSDGATVTASAKGGTPGYIFTLIDSATPPNKVVFPTNGILTNVKPGTYTVSGKDKNDCQDDKDTSLIIADPVAPKVEIKQDNSLCFNGTNAKIIVTISDGVAPYYYQVKYNTGGLGGKVPVTDKSFTYEATATGNYTFVITDDFGCIATAVSQTINPKITADVHTTTSLTCIDPKEATIEVTINGGTTPFSYKVKDNTGTEVYASVGTIAGPKFTYNTTIAGKYTFEITDKNNCTTTAEGNVAAITDPEVTATPTNPKCNGESSGSVTLLGSLGSGGYKYKFDSSAFTDKTIYTGLKAGVKYSYQVMDSKGCISAVKDIMLTEPAAIDGTVNLEPKYTCETNAIITAVGIGGNSTTYTYVLNITKGATTTVVATNNTGIFKDLTVAGAYSVTITDSKGCSVTKAAGTIVDLDPPTAMVVTNDDLKCTTNLVKVTIKSVSGGTGTLKYAITAPVALARPYQLGLEFDKLAPGTYTFTVKDANGCTFSVDHEIKALIPIVIKGEVVKNISCLGSADGSAKFTITDLGNDVDYSYTIDGTTVTGKTNPAPASTTLIVNVPNLAVGNHKLTITDLGTDCSFSKTVEILAPPAEFKITPTTVTPLTCDTNAKAVVNTTGGWGGNRYTLTLPNGTKVGPQDSNTFKNLTVTGSYTVLAEDSNGCKVTDSFILAPEVKPTASIDATTSLCSTATGATIKVTPNAQTNYVYSINGATPQNNGTFAGLIPGKYVVRVTDTSTGCHVDLAEQIVATQLTASLNLIDGPKCNAPNIRIDGEVKGGTPNYTFKVTINGDTNLDATVYNVTGNVFSYINPVATSALAATTYLFTFTDAKGCTTTLTEIVQPKTYPVFTATPNSTILCNGGDSGSITVIIDTDFGVGPYVIDVLNTTTNTPYYTKTTGLPAGNYTVKVTDASGCSKTKTDVIIVEPAPITVDYEVKPITCNTTNGQSLGSITINSVTGGTKNYTYNVKGLNVLYDQTFTNQTGTSQIFKVVDFGYYEIIVTDANNCPKVISKILVASPPDDLDITVIAPPSDCSTGGSAVVAIGQPITGGTITGDGPFYFAIFDGSKPNYPNPVGTFAWLPEDGFKSKKTTFYNLTPGVKYTFIVYDTGSGCYYYETSENAIPTHSKLKFDKLQANNITCLGADNGNVSFKVYSENTVPTDVEYQIFNQLTLAPIGSVGTGVVPAATVPTAYLEINKFGVLPFGNYYVLVTEIDKSVTPNKKGCSVATIPFNITGSTTALKLEVKSTRNANCNPNEGIVEAFGKGGTTFPEVLPKPAVPPLPAVPGSPAEPYLYKIFPDDGTPAPVAGDFTIAGDKDNTFKVEAGDYVVYVRDAYGCITFEKVTVKADPSPEITAVASNQCTATEGAFSISVDFVTKGIGKHQYSVDGGVFKEVPATTPFLISNLTSGTHKVQIRDENNCGNTVSNIRIYSPLTIDASFTIPPVCKNEDGTITAVATDGSGDYEFTLVNNTTVTTYPAQSTGEFTLKAAGNYTVTVKDKITNCDKSYTFDLLIPSDIDFSLASTVPFCTTGQGNDANGTVIVTLLNNDNPPYKYTIQQTAPVVGTAFTQNEKVFTGLTFGTYNVKVESDKGCVLDDNITIAAPIAVSATLAQDEFKCDTNTIKDKIVTITPAGGAGNGVINKYKYSADNIKWVDTNTFNVTDLGVPQTLTYYVKDANECVFSDKITIAPFPKLTAPDVTFGADMDCNNKKQEIIVTIKGGTSTLNPFSYIVYEDGNPITGKLPVTTGNTFTYDALKVGSSYKFEIFDNNTGCSIMSGAKTIPEFDKIELVANASTQVGCFGESTGQISITISGYTGEYQYQILEGGVAITGFSGTRKTADANPFVLPHLLKAGTDYTVLVKETEFPYCDVTSDVVIITEPEVLKLGIISNVNQNCNTAGAVLTIDVASITGGTQAYTYGFAVKGTAYADVVFSSTDFTKTIPTTRTIAPFDEWDVYVKDSNGCYDVRTVTIKLDLVPFDIKAKVATQCFDLLTNEEYVITVTADGVKPLKYSLTNVEETFTLNNQLIVKSPGTYPVYVQDANGCVTEALAAFTILDPLGLSAEITTYPTCNGADGQITLTGSGGSGGLNYEYSKDDVTYYSDPLLKEYVFTDYAPGSYTVYVRDKITLCTKSIPVVVPTAAVVTNITLTPTPVTCFDGKDGTITVTLDASNNNPTYKFSLVGDNGVTRAEQTEPTFSDLPAGKYTVSVMSGRNCPGSATTEVIQPRLIIVTPSVTQFACNAGVNTPKSATIVVTATGGTPKVDKYKYVFIKKGATSADDRILQSGEDNIYLVTNPAGGLYDIEVYDGNSCPMLFEDVEIKPFMSIDDFDIRVVDVITCTNNGENIKVVPTIKGTGVLPALEYTLQDANDDVLEKNTTGLFNNLPVGEYMITVENLDTNCSLKRPHRVYEPNTFKLVANNVVNVTCYDAANGSIDFTLVDSKGTPSVLPNGFDYVITSPVLLAPLKATSPNLGPLTIDNLKAGLYKISATLKDSPFCPVEAEFTIAGPLTPLVLVVQHSEITCVAGNNNGKIIASASGGWSGGYEFQLELKSAPGVAVGPWSWSSNSTFGGLTAGDYVVKVKDSKCEVAKPLELKIPTPIAAIISPDKAMLNCFGDNGATITVDATTGGSGKYLYTLVATYPDGVVTKNGPQESNVFTNLKSGSYKVIVSDDWKCTGVSNIIEIKDPIKVEASVDIKTIEGCERFPVVTLSATGGTGPYKYGTDGITFPFSIIGSSIDITLPATAVDTRYEYYVQDALGCISDFTTVSFSPVPKLVFTNVDVYDIHCKGSSTGSIYVTAIGGLGNYVYTLLDAGKNVITAKQDKPGQFDELAAGNYFVQVNSDDCENISIPVTINEPTTSVVATAVPTDLTCNGLGNGKITVIAEGGTGVLRYAISPEFRQFFESNVFDNLDPGLYTIIVQDENGCDSVIKDVEIKQPDILDLTLVPNSILPEFCDGDKDGGFSIEIVGGTAPYRVVLDNRDGTYEQLTTADHTFSNLVGGKHIVYVLDANDCTAELEIVTPDSVKLLPTAKVNTDCVNNLGANFVTITIDVTNTNPSDIDYALDGSTTYQLSNIFENVAPGRHTVTARHTNGCEQTTLPFIIEVLQPLTLTLADGGLNEIVATATGGGGDYQYTLDGEPYGSVNKFIIYKSGTYTVTVTDKNGCTATATRYFEYIDVCIPNHFTPNGDGINDTWAPGCTINYKDLTFDIFDRYGRVICKYKLGQKWDGRYNGAELPSGDYWYVLKLNDNKDDREFVGHFTLYR